MRPAIPDLCARRADSTESGRAEFFDPNTLID